MLFGLDALIVLFCCWLVVCVVFLLWVIVLWFGVGGSLLRGIVSGVC